VNEVLQNRELRSSDGGYPPSRVHRMGNRMRLPSARAAAVTVMALCSMFLRSALWNGERPEPPKQPEVREVRSKRWQTRPRRKHPCGMLSVSDTRWMAMAGRTEKGRNLEEYKRRIGGGR